MNKNGFSLVEVTIALGLATFAVISVMGLLPVGLNTLRQSADDMAISKITQEISSELLLTPFQQLSNYVANGPRYFDSMGERTEGSGAYFRAEMALAASSYPGSSASSTMSNSIQCVRIHIVSRAHAEQGAITNQRVLHVANSGF
jgi:uncharacterized protein (TIGR02598 family)